MRLPRLIVITDWALPAPVLFSRLEGVLSLGPSVGLQHRHPQADLGQLEEEALALRALTRRWGNPLFVNGPPELARRLGTHLHLPSYRPRVGRADLAPGTWISAAVHDPAQAAALGDVDLALVSPVFPPGSKGSEARPTLGPDGFCRLAAQLPCQAFALGGINRNSVRALTAAAGVAAISAVLRADDPRKEAVAILAALPSAKGSA